MLCLAIPLDFGTAYFAQAKEAATKLLDTELDKSMKKFEAENRDFFGEIHQRVHDHRSRRAPRGQTGGAEAESVSARSVAQDRACTY